MPYNNLFQDKIMGFSVHFADDRQPGTENLLIRDPLQDAHDKKN